MNTLDNWRKTVLFVCVAALGIDPLFFFIPVIDSRRFCVTFDKKLAAAVCVLRTLIDTFYAIHIIFHLITASRSRTSLRGEIVVHSEALRKRRFLFYFIVDIVSVLPIPQVVVFTFIQRKQQSTSLVTKQILKWVMICQSTPRIIRFYPLLKEVTRAFGTVAETKLIGAALNFSLYMLQSHVFGAFWYLGAIEKKDACWREACAKTPGCNLTNLYCIRGGRDNSRFLNTSCPLIDPDQITNSTIFNFGIYINALKSGVVETMDFPRKFFYCFWWGLRNLSALGQNLETSNSVWDNFFAIIICLSGLLLFAVLIGNIQKYLQSTTIRVDEMEEMKIDTEKWMLNWMLPPDLKKRIRSFNDNKWRKTRGTEEEVHLGSLPKCLTIQIKRHIFGDFLEKMPKFKALDDWLLDELCARLKPVIYTKNSYIVREGYPVSEMLFIMRGNVMNSSTCGEGTRFLQGAGEVCETRFLQGAGDVYEDLFTWALDRQTTQLPFSSRTVEAITEVEGFVLSADDLKFVASAYRLHHSGEDQHILRYTSVAWRRWAASLIQAAWRRHSRALREEEGKQRSTFQNNAAGSTTLNLGATRLGLGRGFLLATSLRNIRTTAGARNPRFPHMLSLLPQNSSRS